MKPIPSAQIALADADAVSLLQASIMETVRDAEAIRRRPGPEPPGPRQGQLLPVKSASAGQCLVEYNSKLKEGYLRVHGEPPPKTTV